VSIKISEFFEQPSVEDWNQVAVKSLKLDDPAALSSYVEKVSVEDLTYKVNPGQIEETYLNSFPTTRLLGREILVGQPNTESTDVGIDYIFSYQPVVPLEKQKLIQIVNKKESKFFGDEVLIDVFCLLKQFEFSHEDVLKYLEKQIKNKNVHLLINTCDIHNAGGTVHHEISHALFLALKYCDLFHEHSRKVCFMLSIDSQFYTQIAKLRALRYLYETILEKEELPIDNFLIIGASSLREMTLYDPWVNMLRTCSNTCASFLGGADVILPKSFDSLNQVYNMQQSSDLALRQSRNTFHILKEESHLAFVNDPARGASVIEDLTHQIISKSFVKLKEMNSQKSLRFLYEQIAEEIKLKSIERFDEVTKRKKIICGINNFSNPEEVQAKHFKSKAITVKDDLFPLRRVVGQFENLRLKMEEISVKNPKKILILYYGDLKKLNARISFSQNYFEVLGLKVDVQDTKQMMIYNENDYYAVVYCAQDADYEDMFNVGEVPNHKSLFLAGKKIQKQGFQNIYHGQSIINILEDFVTKVGQK